MTTAILALVSEPAPAGRSSAAGIAIILFCFAAAVLFAARSALRHLKGRGGCCGDGASAPPPDEKPIGPVVARREIEISGMHCMNCVGRVKKALDALEGVSADVTLEPQRANVAMDREVPDSALRAAVEGAGFAVVAVR